MTGERAPRLHERALATVLFVDIVDSTATAAAIGDAQWPVLLERWEALADRELQRYRGRRIHGTGDGMLATFDGPARAIRCALAMRDASHGLDLRCRHALKGIPREWSCSRPGSTRVPPSSVHEPLRALRRRRGCASLGA